MIDAFTENPVLLLFIVVGLGYWIGSIRVRGNALGVAAVLFTGLAFGALSPDLVLPEVLMLLGLSIFVYTIGLQSGPGFFTNLKKNGVRDVLFIIVMLTFSAGITVALSYLFDFKASSAAGLFAGVTTNTPALAGLLDMINNTNVKEVAEQLSREAVVGYSISYPMGVIGVMIAIAAVQKWLKVDYIEEREKLKHDYAVEQEMKQVTIEITSDKLAKTALRDLVKEHDLNVVFGRMVIDGEVGLSNFDTRFRKGQLVRVVGIPEDVEKVLRLLGKEVPAERIVADGSYDSCRIFVSNPKVAGQKLAALNLQENFSAIVTRYRRGDIDILAKGDTILELGDQVRFVARKEDIPRLSEFFGDSYEALSHVNLLSFGLGMGLGLLLGLVTFELPGGSNFKLGFAGGPLIVALILGTLRRTGPIVWTLPYSANLTLRQIGLILLLACIGVNSGYTFKETVAGGGGGQLFLASVVISILTATTTLLIGFKLLKIPFSFLSGMVANQPAILDFALERAGNKLPNVGFTIMLPVALITKIVFVQLLFALLN